MNKYDYLVSQYPDHVVFLKEGRFYLVKSESAYLVNYLFGFRMYFSQDMLCTGCPPELMEKVTEVLKNLQIDYIIVNHDELEEQQEYISNSFRNYENIFHYYDARKEAELQIKKQQEWSQEKVNTIVHILECILEGKNPELDCGLTIEDLREGTVHDSLAELLNILRNIQKYGLRLDQRASFSELFYIDREKAISMLSGEALKISEFTARMNEGKDVTQRKRLGAASITNWLLNQGYLMEVLDEQNRKVRIATTLGQSIGITTEEQKSQKGTYRTNWYNYDAQRFLIEHMMMF